MIAAISLRFGSLSPLWPLRRISAPIVGETFRGLRVHNLELCDLLNNEAQGSGS